MRLLRIVVSDLHLGTGDRPGELNPFEDFHHDDRFVELLDHYDQLVGRGGEIELVMNGDIFDLLKIKVGGKWPIEITGAIAAEKLKQCLDGHPRFVNGLKTFLAKPNRRLVYLPGNHDLDMWFPEAHDVMRRYVAPGDAADRVRFVTNTDTYYLPEGIQIRHGHQLESIHRVDYSNMTTKTRDGAEVLTLPWGSLWILEVLNPAKEERSFIDRIQPLRRFFYAGILFDTAFTLRFIWRTWLHVVRRRLFGLRAWRDRFRNFSRFLREEIALGDFDDHATRALVRTRGAHTLIVGHSHAPRFRKLGSGKVLINTGTWMKMINLDLRYLGQHSGLTYALIEYDDAGQPLTSLMQWNGKSSVCDRIHYAD